MTSVLVVGIVAGLVAGLVVGLVADLVAGLIADLVLFRHIFSEGGVATACSCRDIFLVKLTSRQLIDVATFWSLQLLSRQPGVITTTSLCNCCRDLLMLSRQLLCIIVVATSSVELLSRQRSPSKLML